MAHRTKIISLILVGIVGLLPIVVEDSYILHLFIISSIWIMLATNFNIILSAGQVSFAQIAFYGIGAYTSGILSVKLGVPFIFAMLAAGLFSAFMGYFIGRITLKMRGVYFIIVTFAFAEICRLVSNNWVSLTNGPMGLRNIPVPGIKLWGLLNIEFGSYRSECYLVLFFAMMMIYIAYRLRYSRYGRAFTALKISDDLAESVGIGHYQFVKVALLTSAFLTGITGSLYAHYTTFLSPEIISFGSMVNLLIMVMGGGRNSVSGPIVGALIFTFLPEFLRASEAYRMLIFGALLTVIVLFMPIGIVPTIQNLWLKFSRKLLVKEPV